LLCRHFATYTTNTHTGVLVDGGFVNKIPVEICRARGAGFVIAVSVSPQDFKLEDSFPEVLIYTNIKK
jgi:predicted acylesterase/phospholipase RssA